MKKTKFVLGEVYRVDFLDHSIGGRGLVPRKVVGWCVEVNRDKLVLRYWDTLEGSEDDENTEHISIARGAIIDARRIGSY